MTTVATDKLILKETGLALRPGAVLREAEGGGQIREVVIISEGWGSSGYYSSDVLKRDIPNIFPVGTHMYLNHPTEREDIERPERDVTHLVGKLTSTPRLAGIDMVAEALVYPHWQQVIEAIAADIGLSIRAYGIAEEGDAGGKRGPIIKALTEGQSIDYVTHAGAGGKIGALIESAQKESDAHPTEILERRNALHWMEAKIHRDFTERADYMFGEGYITRDERITLSEGIGKALQAFTGHVEADAPQLLNRDPYADPEGSETEIEETNSGSRSANRTKPEETEMSEVTEKEFAELKESVSGLSTRVQEAETKVSEAEGREKAATERAERAEEALLTREARTVAVKAVESKYPRLGEKAQLRAVEAALVDIPTKEVNGDTKLDESALKELAESKATKEAEYLAEAGAGTVEGFGSSSSVAPTGGSVTESDADKAAKKELQESFEAGGMSEAAAKAAVEGR